MGTAAGCGVPAFFCDCPACEEARRNPQLRRGDCGVMIRGQRTLLIDTPPDTRSQLIRENIRAVDQILYTHAHYDHIGGLGEFEYWVYLGRDNQPLPVYATREARGIIAEEFTYMNRHLTWHDMEVFDTIEYDGVSYQALPVTHSAGAVGYLIETPFTRLFYCSDTAQLPTETAELIKGVDIAAVDATFWGRNWRPDVHHSIDECIEEMLGLNVGKLYLTHLGLHYDTPITYKELLKYLEPYQGRVEPALDGLSFPI